jgi:hypothetical protein
MKENPDVGRKWTRSADNSSAGFSLIVGVMNRLTCSILFSFLMTASCSHTFVGQRLLTIEIELDDQVVFHGIRGVPDNMPVEQMWGVLGTVRFESSRPGSVVKEGAGNPVRSLVGKVIVRIKHVDQELTHVLMETLLFYPDASGLLWSLRGAELERIQDARTD